MTAAEDRETRRAVASLVRRLQERDAAIKAGADDVPDLEPFAAEFMAALKGQGWRPVEVLRPPGDWRLKPQRAEPPESYREARALVDEHAAIAAAQRRGRVVTGEVIPERPEIEAPPPRGGSP